VKTCKIDRYKLACKYFFYYQNICNFKDSIQEFFIYCVTYPNLYFQTQKSHPDNKGCYIVMVLDLNIYHSEDDEFLRQKERFAFCLIVMLIWMKNGHIQVM